MLCNMLLYFGPLSPGLVKYVKNSPWCQVLIDFDRSFDKNTPRKLFRLWKDIKGLKPCDKEFFGQILNLNPILKPPVKELLNEQWFHLL